MWCGWCRPYLHLADEDRNLPMHDGARQSSHGETVPHCIMIVNNSFTCDCQIFTSTNKIHLLKSNQKQINTQTCRWYGNMYWLKLHHPIRIWQMEFLPAHPPPPQKKNQFVLLLVMGLLDFFQLVLSLWIAASIAKYICFVRN